MLAEFVKGLGVENKYTHAQLVQNLLTHFPLLHPGNDKVKDEYLRVIPQVSSFTPLCHSLHSRVRN